MQSKLPVHIAIIPDGNRRWAKAKGLEPWVGHEEGANNIEALVRKALEIGIKSMSFWGSSLENLTKRPLEEKRELLRIYEEYFKRLIESSDIFDNEVKINVIGRWKKQLPSSLVKIIEEGMEKTKGHSKHQLNFFLAYSGDDEMIETVKKIVQSEIEPGKIDANVIKQNLWTKDLPPVDYLIRTGGEPHLSVGFMMWEIANAQLFFADEYFPDFGPEQLEKAVEEYQERGRRKGA